jgi:methylmalonyl-CoA mutase C-terminal domain/subunit
MRKIRVLVGKPGLDGHDRGAKVVAAALRDSGMEVIYTGLHQSPEQIVEAAIQEDVDVVALSVLSGAHMTLFPEVMKLMRDRGIGDRLLTGGGIIPSEDMETLARKGVGRLFGPGASTQDIGAYIRSWVDEHGSHEDARLAKTARRGRASAARKPSKRRAAQPVRATRKAKARPKRATRRGAVPPRARGGASKVRPARRRVARPRAGRRAARGR